MQLKGKKQDVDVGIGLRIMEQLVKKIGSGVISGER
jgi:hypothetical protein